MIRQALKPKTNVLPNGFRLRGMDHTRIEGLSDSVFAIAIALLLISADVPEKFSELKLFLKDFIPFGITITLLMLIWHEHYTFFIRYGLKDNLTVFLNTILLLLVLFYVYPLKFLFKTLFTLFSGIITKDQESIEILFTETITIQDTPSLMVIYGFGAAAIFTILALLYFYAFRRREELELDDIEVFDTISSMGLNLVSASIPVISMVVAYFEFAGRDTFMVAGFIYFLYPLFMPGYSIWRNKKRKILVQLKNKENE